VTDTSELNPIAERILLIMQQKGMNPSRLAKELGVSQATMSDIKNGKTPPSLDVLLRLCQKYRIDANWLAFGVGSPYLDQEGVGPNNNDPDSFTDDDIGNVNVSVTIERAKATIRVPGLVHFFENSDLLNRVNITPDEVIGLVKIVRSNPLFYHNAKEPTFLEMLQSYREQQLAGINTILGTSKPKKADH
jgi:transcriptional regulator with XRE-family HTH domain